VINETAARRLGFDNARDAVGKIIREPDGKRATRVVGVAPDIRHRSAREPMQPTVYYLSERTGTFTIRSAVRSEHALDTVRQAIEDLWPRWFPNETLGLERVAASFARSYADDLRLAKLLGASSVIAIAIAAFGIYVLAAYSVRRREREIVLRKLYGAGSAAIGGLVAREFAALLGIGALLGLPLGWLAIQRYLGDFTERAPIGAWTLVGALLVACLVALASTLRHALAAVRIRPALALRE
jgi:putative ABC transport system permease protein